MNRLDFDSRFNLLVQESYLSKQALLTGFEGLLKANYYSGLEGGFYQGFFNISIGLERLLKLVFLTDFMLCNGYRAPSERQLKSFGHNICELYECIPGFLVKYNVGVEVVKLFDVDEEIVEFFSEFAMSSRYHNLNEICSGKLKVSPLYKWLRILREVYSESVSCARREANDMRIILGMARNNYTFHQDETGHPLTEFDILQIQNIARKSGPMVVWRIIELFRPVYHLLEAMADRGRKYEESQGVEKMVVPHYEDFFHFFLADRKSCLRRKKWLV